MTGMTTRRQLIRKLVEIDNQIEEHRHEEIQELEAQRDNLVETLYGEPSLDEYEEVRAEIS